MNFLFSLIFMGISFVAGYIIRALSSRVDLVYIKPTDDFKKEAKKFGFRVIDISDKAHPYLIEVHYADHQEETYYAFLERHGVSDKSPRCLEYKARNK